MRINEMQHRETDAAEDSLDIFAEPHMETDQDKDANNWASGTALPGGSSGAEGDACGEAADRDSGRSSSAVAR